MNVLASKLKLDPVKVRQVNYIKKEKFPFKTPGGYTYDTRRLRDEPRQGAPGLGIPEAEAGAEGGQGGGPPLRHRDLHLDRDLRLRPRVGARRPR